eukprot:TRINITY_DN9149_c0_g2_i4.p2 TRINITY_DN9149_c0_g2~~TRINITY_DN9149_c0_g2_i4.p2  ORF type:complete len:137 (-),score=18.92 TRINITY_DN9149_c0_g2_i4:161-571(-)
MGLGICINYLSDVVGKKNEEPAPGSPEGAESNEYVSKESSQNIVFLCYYGFKKGIRFAKDILIAKNFSHTVAVFLTIVLITFLSQALSDATMIWVLLNTVFVISFCYMKHKELIQSTFENLWTKIKDLTGLSLIHI